MNRNLPRTLAVLIAASLLGACSKEPAPAKPASAPAPAAEPKKEEAARPMPPSAPTAAPAEGEKK